MLDKNEIPDSRSSGLLINISPNNFLLIGGGSREKAFGDIWQLSVSFPLTKISGEKTIKANKIFSWKKLLMDNINDNPFNPRFGHCGLTIRNDIEGLVQLYIHGGQNHFESSFFSDFFSIKIKFSENLNNETLKNNESFNKNDNQLSKKSFNSSNFQLIEFRNIIKYPTDIKNTPCERNSHSMCIDNINKKILYIFGGGNSIGLLNDLWEYNFDNEKFNLITLEENKIPSREMHGMIYYKDNLYILGGRLYDSIDDKIYKINLTTLKLDSDFTKLPRALCSFAYSPYKNYIIIYGGSDGVSFLNSIYIYNLNNNKWAKSKLNFDISGQLIKIDGKIGSHMSVDEENDTLDIFGGSSIHEDSNEAYVLSLSDLLNENNLIKVSYD